MGSVPSHRSRCAVRPSLCVKLPDSAESDGYRCRRRRVLRQRSCKPCTPRAPCRAAARPARPRARRARLQQLHDVLADVPPYVVGVRQRVGPARRQRFGQVVHQRRRARGGPHGAGAPVKQRPEKEGPTGTPPRSASVYISQRRRRAAPASCAARPAAFACTPRRVTEKHVFLAQPAVGAGRVRLRHARAHARCSTSLTRRARPHDGSSTAPGAAHVHKPNTAKAALSTAKNVIFSDYAAAPVDGNQFGKRMPPPGARRRGAARVSVPTWNRSVCFPGRLSTVGAQRKWTARSRRTTAASPGAPTRGACAAARRNGTRSQP